MTTICLKYFYLFTLFNFFIFAKSSKEDLWRSLPEASEEVQEQAVKNLIQRLLPNRHQEFQIYVNQSLLLPDYKDKFILSASEKNFVKITATSGVAAANGFHYFLKHLAHCHVSWSANQLNLSDPLPQIDRPIKVVIQDKLRYYQNVCTLSYSMVWWSWERWERELDWMALQGINFPLAFVGQELIWQRTFEKFNLTKQEIEEYFTGPAFLAWNRMGNVQNWAGPLTKNWHQNQLMLQKQILKRMKDFGMLPIYPAFAGHVPKNITRLYPNANVTKFKSWGRFNSTFCCTSFLEPSDPLFEKIGTTFVKEMTKEFGSSHFYNTDLFNEMTPRSRFGLPKICHLIKRYHYFFSDINYLTRCGKAVYKSISKADSKAIWVMQGWLFHYEAKFWKKPQVKALLTAVPKGKLIILDLWSEIQPVYQQLDGYFGQPWIWCMLQNFGGALGLYGASNRINYNGVFDARKKYSNMLGIGLTPEGIEQNDVIYDFMMETTWHSNSIDLKKWFSKYSIRRYGTSDNKLIAAWDLLRKSVYTDPSLDRRFNSASRNRFIFVRRPRLNASSPLWYNTTDVFKAWKLFIETAQTRSELQLINSFKYDLVDLTRQCLQLTFDLIYKNLFDSFKNKEKTKFDHLSQTLLTVLDDTEKILASDEHFLLGKWIQSAKSIAVTEEEKRQNEYNARNQVTLWGPQANILDYASKQWAGLMSQYYKPRWLLFIKFLNHSLEEKTHFNQTEFNEAVFNQVELKFVNQNQSFPTNATGNYFEIANEIFQKYQNIIIRSDSTTLNVEETSWSWFGDYSDKYLVESRI